MLHCSLWCSASSIYNIQRQESQFELAFDQAMSPRRYGISGLLTLPASTSALACRLLASCLHRLLVPASPLPRQLLPQAGARRWDCYMYSLAVWLQACLR